MVDRVQIIIWFMQDDERKVIEQLSQGIEAQQKSKPDFVYGCSIGGCLGMIVCPALLLLIMFLFVPDDIDTPAAFFIGSLVSLVLSIPVGAVLGAIIGLLVVFVRSKIAERRQ